MSQPTDRQSTLQYRTIVADPPWEVQRNMSSGGRRRRSTAVPYEFMSLDEIKALPVANFAHPDGAVLFLWTTRRLFREGEAAAVARAWGFEPAGEIHWGLRNPGMGAGPFLNDHEPVLVAKRGSVDLEGYGLGGVWFWRQLYAAGNGGKVHSAKPEGFLDHVEQIAPEPRIELFSRRARLGWDTWGNESLQGGVA